MLKPVLEYFDQREEFCYLETHNPKNIPFYEKHGFTLKDITFLPNSSTQHFGMYRSPNIKNK
jgi:hypothetical protein